MVESTKPRDGVLKIKTCPKELVSVDPCFQAVSVTGRAGGRVSGSLTKGVIFMELKLLLAMKQSGLIPRQEGKKRGRPGGWWGGDGGKAIERVTRDRVQWNLFGRHAQVTAVFASFPTHGGRAPRRGQNAAE